MSDKTSIEWTATVHPDGSVTPGSTWNPVRGCTKVSPGCANCYAETFAERWRGVPGHPYEQGFDLRLVPEKLTEPLSWKKPRRVFVNSMSDLFQDGVPDEYIDRVFAVMAWTPWHTYQVLTKRAHRMRSYFAGAWHQRVVQMYIAMRETGLVSIDRDESRQRAQGWAFGAMTCGDHDRRVLPNVWLGASVENQRFADERIPLLLQTPAAVRFISAEPLLEPIDIKSALIVPTHSAWQSSRLDWVIVGGESGPGARPFDVAWARSLVSQCRSAGVPVFVKQLGYRAFDSSVDLNAVNYQTHAVGALNRLVYLRLHQSKGADMAEWPADLQVREFPREARG